MTKIKKPFNLPFLPLQSIDWDEILVLSIQANREIAKYDTLINSKEFLDHLLITTFSRKESVCSTRIEGTQITTDAIIENQLNEDNNKNSLKNIIETTNYLKTYLMAIKRIKVKSNFNVNFILNMHQDLKLLKSNPGKYRSTEVFIGSSQQRDQAIYVPPHSKNVYSLLSNFVAYFNKKEKDDLVQLAILHAQFELIHPFIDGNGRLGRLLIPLFLFMKKVTSKANFFLSEFFEKYKLEYYHKLKLISENNDWTGWIQFFLRGIIEQSQLNQAKIQKVILLFEKIKGIIQDIYSPNLQNLILKFIFLYPVFRAEHFESHLQLSTSKTYRIINTLVKKKIIFAGTGIRYRRFYFQEFREIIQI